MSSFVMRGARSADSLEMKAGGERFSELPCRQGGHLTPVVVSLSDMAPGGP